MAPLRKSECMLHTPLLTSVILTAKRSMQIPIQISTGSFEDKEIEYFTFSYLHGS
jgi:hypothetical protein